MRVRLKKSICILLCLCCALLCSCRVSRKFLKEKEQGLYPDPGDFPNTKWVCREIDMYFYMFDYNEDYMPGIYTVGDESYRVVGDIFLSDLTFNIYSTTQISRSEYSKDGNNYMVHCNRVSCGHIYTTYSGNVKTGTIVCSLNTPQTIAGEAIPETLTFDKTEDIAQDVNTRWYYQDLDIYLDSFNDVEDYYSGRIVIGGKECFVHALEVGNNNYYMLSIETGREHKYTDILIYMYFELHENQIIARVSDECISKPYLFSNWECRVSTVTFKPVDF